MGAETTDGLANFSIQGLIGLKSRCLAKAAVLLWGLGVLFQVTVVGRIQFLATVGQEPLAPRGHPHFLATCSSLQHSSLLVQGQEVSISVTWNLHLGKGWTLF